jgi:hypothetical protein
MSSAYRDQPLYPFQKNFHSQNGEDGILEELLKRINSPEASSKWCVEFGAWDGMHLSNTFTLVENGWNAVHIEGDEVKYQDLLATAAKHPTIVPINAYVCGDPSDPNSLDHLLARTPIPSQFGILSIDIDSHDLDVWEALTVYSPAIVVIEINSSVPPGIVWRHSEKTPGNTFSATQNVARAKGYTLAAHTGNNIYVRNDLVEKAALPEKYRLHPELLFNPAWLRDP